MTINNRVATFTTQLKCSSIFSCDLHGSDIVAVGGENGFCEVYRLQSSTLQRLMTYNAQRVVNAIRFSPNGELLALGLVGGDVRVVNMKGERIAERKLHQGLKKFKVKLADQTGKKKTSSETDQKTEKELKMEEHCCDICWKDNSTIISGGTDEMIYIWKIGSNESFSKIGSECNLSVVFSLCLNPRNGLLIARCSTCLVSIDPEISQSQQQIISCFGNRVSLDDNEISKIDSKEREKMNFFVENGFQIRGALSPDGLYYLCPSSKSPWNNEGCTLLMDQSLENVLATIILPKGETSISAIFCPQIYPLTSKEMRKKSTFPYAKSMYLFAIGTQNSLLIYSSIQMVPITSAKSNSLIVEMKWGIGQDMFVMGASIDGRLIFVRVPSGPQSDIINEQSKNTSQPVSETISVKNKEKDP